MKILVFGSSLLTLDLLSAFQNPRLSRVSSGGKISTEATLALLTHPAAAPQPLT